MEIILIHGNALSGISDNVVKIKQKYDPMAVITYSGKNKSFDQVAIELSTPQLFVEERLVVLEEFDDKIDLEKLPIQEGLTVLLRFSKLLTPSSALLKQAVQKRVKVLALTEKDEISVFPFLDALAEKDKKAFFLFEKLYEEYGGQYILTMIFYMLRRLVLPIGKLPDFVAKKIGKQKQNFDIKEIEELYKNSLETDFKVKSGLLDEKVGLSLLIHKIVSS